MAQPGQERFFTQRMKILISAVHVRASAKAGGSSTYFETLAWGFMKAGHKVMATNDIESVRDGFDLIITSHDKLKRGMHLEGFNVHVCHGTFPNEEQPYPGADYYVAISEEVHYSLVINGFFPRLIRQPIKIPDKINRPKELKNILFIKNNATRHVWDIPGMSVSDPNRDIFEQIEESDLVIAIGRGAAEAMSRGRPVIAADTRWYRGFLSDGYLSPSSGKLVPSMRNNYSGISGRHEATDDHIVNEILKYNHQDSIELFKHAREHHDVDKICKKFIELVR